MFLLSAINVLPVMIGAAAGATFRHLAVVNVQRTTALFRICMINTTGSFALGAIQSLRYSKRLSPTMAAAIGSGFCGALTTFSTFSAQTFDLMTSTPRRTTLAATYVTGSIILGMVAVGCGRFVGRSIF